MSPVLFLSGNHQRRLGHKVRPAITLLEATCHDCRDRVEMQILSTVVLFMCWIFLSSSCCEQGGAKQWITKYWYDCILMFRTVKCSFSPDDDCVPLTIGTAMIMSVTILVMLCLCRRSRWMGNCFSECRWNALITDSCSKGCPLENIIIMRMIIILVAEARTYGTYRNSRDRFFLCLVEILP